MGGGDKIASSSKAKCRLWFASNGFNAHHFSCGLRYERTVDIASHFQSIANAKADRVDVFSAAARTAPVRLSVWQATSGVRSKSLATVARVSTDEFATSIPEV